MADRKLNIILGIKSEMASGLASAKGALESFGTSAMNIGKTLAAGFVAGAAALTAFATKALTSYAEQEKATSSLKASLRAYGDEIEVNTAAIKAQASAIQDETGVSDDALVARAAKLKMLGVETDALGDALKATVALAQYGLEEEMAVRAVANAREGNFSALERYIPALRSAATETEKQIVLNDFLAKGYDAQKATLGTLAGQWGLLKERVGDAWEEIGAAIAQNDTITNALSWLNEKVAEFGQSIKEWVSNGGIENFKAVMMGTLENISFGFQLAVKNVVLFFSLFRDNSVFQYFAGNVMAAVKTAWEQIKYLGDWAAAVWDKIKNPMGEFKAPSTDGIKAAMQGMLDAAIGKDVKETDHYAKALADREALLEEHKARVMELEDQHLAALDEVNRKRIESEKIALQASLQNNVSAVNKVIAAEEAKTEAIVEHVEVRASKEEEALASVESVNIDAADSVSSTWDDAYSSIADSSIAAADVAIKSANAIKESMSDGPKGGTIETSASYNAAKLKAAGLDPNMASGTVLSGNEAMNLKNVTQDAILRELEQMNANQQKLLTMG